MNPIQQVISIFISAFGGCIGVAMLAGGIKINYRTLFGLFLIIGASFFLGWLLEGMVIL